MFTSIVRHLFNIANIILPPTHFFKIRVSVLSIAKFKIGNRVNICGRCWFYGKGSVSIGDDSWLSPGSVIYTHESVGIFIGQRCDLGPEIRIITGTHKVGNSTRRAGDGMALPITIGDGCWIGARSTILGGVTIGNGCVVAAGSVVTKDVPDNTMVAGVPARVKKHLS